MSFSPRMDRDRRPRDIPPEDQFGNGRGQSYRPGKARDRTPPRMDSYRARSPPSRRPDYLDSYRGPRVRSRSPPGPPPSREDFRRRSPSPRFREHDLRGGDSYRAPPPRRDELPRDDLFRRDAARDPRDFHRGFRDDVRDRGFPPPGRSPLPRFRDRSPMPLKRGRDPSPISSRGRRSPPPPKRERLGSPQRPRFDDLPPSRGPSSPRRRFSPNPRDRRPSPPRNAAREFRPRSRSPPIRSERPDPRQEQDWRKPASPMREPRHGNLGREESGHSSAATSRRSSPPSRPNRAPLSSLTNDDHRPPSRASPHDSRKSAEPFRAPTTESQGQGNADTHAGDMVAAPSTRDNNLVSEPRRPEEPQPSTPRAPPTGPAGQRHPAVSSNPPTGPSATASVRTPTAPPSGPRNVSAGRGDFASRGRGGYGTEYTPRGRGGSYGLSYRGGRGGTPTGPGYGRVDGRSDVIQQESSSVARGSVPPSGPRASTVPQGPAASYRQSSAVNSPLLARPQRFGSSGESATEPTATAPPTGPKATRRPTEPFIGSSFSNAPRVHPALADLPQIIEGGKKAEPLVDRSKLTALEEEAEKLRKILEEKETRNRKLLREWDRMTRDTEAAAFRSDLAERALRHLNGEAEAQAAF